MCMGERTACGNGVKPECCRNGGAVPPIGGSRNALAGLRIGGARGVTSGRMGRLAGARPPPNAVSPVWPRPPRKLFDVGAALGPALDSCGAAETPGIVCTSSGYFSIFLVVDWPPSRGRDRMGMPCVGARPQSWYSRAMVSIDGSTVGAKLCERPKARGA